MTQQKSKKLSKKQQEKIARQQQMNAQFRAFDKSTQDGVINFFNAHNVAGFIYSQLSSEAREYIDYFIGLSMEANKETKKVLPDV